MMLNRPAGLAESPVGEPEIAKRDSLATAVPNPAIALQRCLTPSNPFARMQPEVQNIDTVVRIGRGQSRRIVRLRYCRRRPALPGLDVGPLPVEQRQAIRDGVATSKIKRVRLT